MDVDVGCGVRWSCAPVGAPGDGGNKAHVGEQDGVVLDAVQGEVHLAQRQPVQLELQLHLQPFKHRQSGQAGYDPVASGTGWTGGGGGRQPSPPEEPHGPVSRQKRLGATEAF